MKHIVMSRGWAYGVEPFPAYRAELIYGRNKRDREFLPVQGVTPVTTYTVTAEYGKIVLYSGTDKIAAEAAKAKFDSAIPAEERATIFGGTKNADLTVGSVPVLPEGKFRVIKTREKGTIMVVPGDDDTKRCLLFVGCKGGFRGGVSVIKDTTTGAILKECSAGNACESSREVIVLLEPGQHIAFHETGRRHNDVREYAWDGEGLKMSYLPKPEWDMRSTVAAPVGDAEVL
ncbi:MAG: hypothetical protein Q8P06_02055 [Candidatus Azambacteria bacterium]|nr:hypothetical protein [Candidatus Azambacteria bacterium]